VCDGAGKVSQEHCTTCKGAGVRRKEEEVEIKVPAGIESGEMIRLTSMGEAVRRGASGDLYVKINVTPHQIFRRDRQNLLMDMEVRLSEALLGAERTIETLDGPVTVKIPEGIASGTQLRVREKGVSMRGGKRGDLMIKVTVKIPTKLSRASKTAIETLKAEGL
jgi:molecular chaperone DnaJ